MLTNINQLENTHYNRLYGAEIVRSFLSHPMYQDRHILNWIMSEPRLQVFTITVTYKNLVALEVDEGFKKAALSEYRKRVLTKVKRRLSRTPSKWRSILPWEEFVQYEKEQGSFFKPVSSSKSPHHIHGLFPVVKDLAPRIYNYDTQTLDTRLHKDLESMRTIQHFKIEPIRVDEYQHWYNYMMKGKINKNQ